MTTANSLFFRPGQNRRLWGANIRVAAAVGDSVVRHLGGIVWRETGRDDSGVGRWVENLKLEVWFRSSDPY